jgi:manganese/zinc/iron transport system substrate-binding protein
MYNLNIPAGRWLAPLCAVLAFASASACAPDSARDAGGAIRVVATTSLVADLVRNVGGDRVDLTALMGSGVDPHLYRASEGDVRALSRADVIFYNGLHLEAKMSEVLERMHGSTRTFAVSDGVDRARLLSPPEFAGNYDPHIWFDVSMWRSALDHVRASLVEVSPADSALFNANAATYAIHLDSLDSYVRERAATVPQSQRVIVTAHDAFNYFGRAYGFEVRGLQGISTAAEAGAADVRELAQFIADRKIPAVFVESSVPRRSIEAVQAAVASRGFNVSIGGQLFSDALGDGGTPEATYLGMVRHNIDTITSALLNTDPPLQ